MSDSDSDTGQGNLRTPPPSSFGLRSGWRPATDAELEQSVSDVFVARKSLVRTPPSREAVAAAAQVLAAAMTPAAVPMEVSLASGAEKRRRNSAEDEGAEDQVKLGRGGRGLIKKPEQKKAKGLRAARKEAHVPTPSAAPLVEPAEEITVTSEEEAVAKQQTPTDSAAQRLLGGGENAQGTLAPSEMTKAQIMDGVGRAVADILGITTGENRRLNKADICEVSVQGHIIMSLMATLDLRLAEAECRNARLNGEIAEMKLAAAMKQTTVTEVNSLSLAPCYAGALKIGGANASAQARRIPEKTGPTITVYPAENAKESLKTAEATKNKLKTVINPAKLQMQVSGLRKVGNAGVVIRTGTKEAAEALKQAGPKLKEAGLRVVERKAQFPLVALKNLEDKDVSFDDLMDSLHEQNFGGDQDWSLEKLKGSCKLAFKKTARYNSTTYVLECKPALRQALVEKGRIFLGWESITVEDFLNVTCCYRCQMYGHPAKACKAEKPTCSNCGTEGHRFSECTSKVTNCGTCKRLKREANHRTNSRDCPARRHAEERLINNINYGR